MSPLTQQFLDRSIDPAKFGHKQHVQVAFELLGEFDFMEATVQYVSGIRDIATGAGAPEKFHITITLAYLSVIAERMVASGAKTFEDFLEGNLDLLSKNSLAGWYAPERLNSTLARQQFVLPESVRASA